MDCRVDRHRPAIAPNRRGRLLAVIPLLFVSYLFVYPMVRIVWIGLNWDTGRTILESLTSPTVTSAAWFTIWQAAASTALTLLIGIPAAWAVTRSAPRAARWFMSLSIIPFALPTVVVGVAFLQLLGPQGPFNIDLRRSVPAILIAHVFYNVPLVVRVVGTRWLQLSSELEEAAGSLGAGRIRQFVSVTLPRLLPSLTAAASLVFLLTFTAFGTVLILGGLRYRTLEVEIWRAATQALDLKTASVLALLQLVGVAVLLSWNARTGRKFGSIGDISYGHRSTSPWASVWLGLVSVGLLIPILSLLVGSVRTSEGWGLENFAALLTGDSLGMTGGAAVLTSLSYAVAATLIAVLIGSIASWTIAGSGPAARTFDTVLMLPLGTSAVTIGLGFLVALDWPIDLRGTQLLVPLAHALVAIPFVTQTMTPVLRSIDPGLREAATSLGATPREVFWTVDWPIVRKGLKVGAGFAFVISLGEFGATSFIARPATPTMPLLIYRALSRPGTASLAAAGSVLLLAVTATVLILLERDRR
jgi:thiamine transport system permease protein